MKIGKVINYDINIKPTSNYGFIVKVGCGQFAFGSKESLIEALEDFLNHPADCENQYSKTTVEVPGPRVVVTVPDPNPETDAVQTERER